MCDCVVRLAYFAECSLKRSVRISSQEEVYIVADSFAYSVSLTQPHSSLLTTTNTFININISELDPDQLPPLDENGIPKYKGRKRGRKPKVRKRKSNPARKKRQHTAYTLFVQHSYPAAKAANPGWPSKDVISYVAKQWAVVPVDKKAKWKARAQSTHVDADDEEGKEGVQDVGAMEDDDDEDVEDNNHALEDDEDDNQAPLNLQAAVAAAAAAAVQAGFGQDDAYGMDNVAVAAAATGGTASEEEQDLHDDEDGEEEDDAAPPARRRGRAPRKK